jgi:hypothetical protein
MRKLLARHLRSFESLEARHMLAGNVTAQLIGGDVFIAGDLADNNILIQGTVVTGRTSGGSATSINGTPNGSFNFAAFTQHLNVTMAAGTDVVEVNGLTVPGNLSINTGNGADLLKFNPVRVDVAGSISLVTEAGGDRVLLTGGTTAGGAPGHRAGGNLSIDVGGGNDEVRVTEFTVGGSGTVELGSDADLCDIRFSFLATGFFINGGSEYDSISVDTCSSSVGTFNGNADITTLVVKNSRFTGNLGLFTTGTDDFVLLQTSRIDGVAALVMDGAGGTGNDNFLVRGSVVHELQAVMEGGTDKVDIQNSALDRLFAYFGEGADWLLFSNSIVNETTQADGGGGLDLFTRGGSLLSGLSFNGFEVIQ